jgi:rare lipoprotein A
VSGPARLLALVSALILGGCSGGGNWEDSEPASQPTATSELPRSKQGNPPFYEVYGVRYSVMKGSTGYRQRGVASWYGKKFHGRSTSSGERYNMYAMTAAHKTLPLPTNVRVTNLDNGKSITVRVNDRGPFVKNRLIDLSYSAAKELDIIGNGTGMVEVVALNRSAGTTAQDRQKLAAATAQNSGATHDDVRMFVQVGAFGEQANAKALANKLNANGINSVSIQKSTANSSTVYKVQIGPVKDVDEYDEVVQKVERLQLTDTHLVVEPG